MSLTDIGTGSDLSKKVRQPPTESWLMWHASWARLCRSRSLRQRFW